jgi:putative transposase
MAKPYSEDLRRRVVETIEGGTTIPEAAEQCGVSISSVVRFLKLQRETGSVDSAKFGGYKDFALAAHEDLVRQLVAEQPDITLAELADRLTKKKITVGKSSISRFLHHLKLPLKKVCGQPNRIARTWPPPVGRCSGDRRGLIREGSYSSMKPACRRQLHVCTVDHRGVNGWSKRCCTETGRPLHSSQHCVTTALPHPLCLKAP